MRIDRGNGGVGKLFGVASIIEVHGLKLVNSIGVAEVE
jgi:hypothetical protein